MDDLAKAEKKRADFQRLALQRVAKARDSIRLVGNMSNRRYYDYSAEEAEEAISALEEELTRTRGRFAAGLGSVSPKEEANGNG